MKEILLTSSVLILALLALRRVFRKTISRRLQYALWGLVLLRLLVPVNLPAVDHNVLTAAQPVQRTITRQLEERPIYVLPVQRQDVLFASNAPTEPVVVLPVEGRYTQVTGEKGETPVMTSYALSLQEALLLTWGAGATLMAIWMLTANFRFWRNLCKVRKPYTVDGARYPVYLVEEGLTSPCLFGLFRPAVYLTPASAANPDTLRHVLAHEETHGRHGDPLWSLLRCVCLAAYWFNPLVWAAALASKADCELACDEGALKRLGEAERIPYGRTLLSLIPVRKTPGSPLLTATTMTAGKKQLKDRITRIAENRKTVGIALLAALALTGVVCAATFTAPFSSAGNPVPLTQAEIRRANEAICLSGTDSVIDLDSENFDQLLQICCFFTSYYDDPSEIRLGEFLRYCPLGTTLTEEDSVEWEQLKANPWFALYWGEAPESLSDMPVPVHRYLAKDVSALLKTYADITLEDITQWEDVIYVDGPFYNDGAFYNFTSDFGPGYFRCTGGEKEGDTVRLWDDFRKDGTRSVLTVQKEGDDWFIRSFKRDSGSPAEEDSAFPDGPLTGEELRYFNEEFFNGDTTLAQFRRQFLLSIYEGPPAVDLFQLFYNGVGGYMDVTPEERQAAAQASPYGEDPGVDLIKIPAYSMKGLVKDWSGISLEDTNQVGLENFTYLEEYDAYYHFCGDTNARGEVSLFAGERKDGLIRLYYWDYENGGDCKCVSLQETESGYTFFSNLAAEKPVIDTIYPAQTPEITIPLDGLAADRPAALNTIRQTNNVDQIINFLDLDEFHVVLVYQGQDGGFYAGVEDIRLNSYQTQVFLTIDYDAPEERINIGSYKGILGHDGFWISYPVLMGTTYTTYYYFGEDGNVYELVTAETSPQAVDL
ncbi:MAG: M56 family metallopeptidase, partial [Oscillibacter sp.]|nr:M56 family metallopeptidase [Oscillibacter sp.]